MRKVPWEQEINPLHVPPLMRIVKEYLESIDKDVDKSKIDAFEDENGRRWLRIMVEVA